MQSKGVNAGYLAKLITQSTGYNPRQLWAVQDATVLREAIFNYEASIQVSEHDGNPSLGTWNQPAKNWKKPRTRLKSYP